MSPTELRREIDWYIQNRLTLSAPVFKRRVRLPEIQAGFDPAQRARFEALAAGYDLGAWARVCSPREYVLNLYTLDMLDRYASRPAILRRGLDVGAGNWSYLPALAAWTHTPWDGVELDAHRRDWTLATRRAYANYMTRAYPDCRYLAGSLEGMAGACDSITWFLPFVRVDAFAATRLPRRFFTPERMLAHAWSLLAPGGTMFVVNQGEAESAEQQRLFEQAGIAADATGRIDSGFSPFRMPRFGWRTLKPASTALPDAPNRSHVSPAR